MKPGHVEGAVALAREQKARYAEVVPVRLYAPGVSPPHTIAVEFEFDNPAALDALWTRMGADPDWAAFMERWNALMASGGTDTNWTPVE